jgi:hypothetical protein
MQEITIYRKNNTNPPIYYTAAAKDFLGTSNFTAITAKRFKRTVTVSDAGLADLRILNSYTDENNKESTGELAFWGGLDELGELGPMWGSGLVWHDYMVGNQWIDIYVLCVTNGGGHGIRKRLCSTKAARAICVRVNGGNKNTSIREYAAWEASAVNQAANSVDGTSYVASQITRYTGKYAYEVLGGEKIESSTYTYRRYLIGRMYGAQGDTPVDIDLVVIVGKLCYLVLDANGGTGTAPILGTTPGGVGYSRDIVSSASPWRLRNYIPENDFFTSRDPRRLAFAGWNTAQDGTGTSFADGADAQSLYTSSVTGKIVTLYAQWAVIPTVTHTVVLNAAATTDAGAELPTGCNASIVSPDEPYDVDGQGRELYEEGTSFTASISTAPGWKPVMVAFTDGAGISRGSLTLDADATSFTFGGSNFTYNLVATVLFTRKEYDLAAGVYQDGKGAGGTHLNSAAFSAVSVTKDGVTVTKGKIGDAVVFSATPASGYEFVGWYDEGGNLVVAAADCTESGGVYSYTATVGSADLKFYARAKVSVTFAIGYPDETADAGKTCSLSVNGETLIAVGDESAEPVDVLLGDSLEYALTAGMRPNTESLWGFDGWFSDDTVVGMPLVSTLTPSTNASYTAEFVEDATKTLQVIVMVHTGETTNIRLGEDAATSLLIFTENVRAPITSDSQVSGPNGPMLGDVDPGWVEKTVNGTQYVNVTAATGYTYDGTAYSFHSFAKAFADSTTTLPADSDILSGNPSYTFLLNEDRKESDGKALYVFYGAASLVDVGLDRIGELNSGFFEITAITSDAQGTTPATGEGEVIATGGQSAHVLQGHYIKVRAVANNGYRFAGWYWNNQSMGGPDYADAESVVGISATSTLYAKFERDAHSICEWEGSTRNKVMEWRSKIYSAPQPFNPAGCRVDATGYKPNANLVLSVEMFSSPDAEPTATATLENITSQDARRLPIRRRERFMRVCVKSDAEVDGIFIATSMGGLAT